MNFEKAIVPSQNKSRHTRPEEQTGFRLNDARLERREEAKRRAQGRKS